MLIMKGIAETVMLALKACQRAPTKLSVDDDDMVSFVVGPPRYGKDAGLIIPMALRWPDTLVVLDMRGESGDRVKG